MKNVHTILVLLFLSAFLASVTPAKGQTKNPSEAGTRIVLTVDGVEYAFRWCPPGEFMMGSTRKTCPDEQPVHKVRLTQGFWLLETEVTQEMWYSLLGKRPGFSKEDKLPATCVNFDDCLEFCEKLSQKLGQKVQLPTEAQWEYACRAGSTDKYAGELDEMAWYQRENMPKTEPRIVHPVGLKKPNAWGLYDMYGNVQEWCTDWYDTSYYEVSPETDPTGPPSGKFHVIRGGNFYFKAKDCRSASRYGITAPVRNGLIGLRVLWIPDSEK